MAYVKKLDPKEFERPNLHAEVDATCAVFEKDGMKLFQIDTYGRPGRVIPGKVSQSLQFDQQSARQLMEILRREFGE